MRTQHTRTVEIVTYTVRCDHCGAQPPTSGRDALHGAGWTLGDEDVCQDCRRGLEQEAAHRIAHRAGRADRADRCAHVGRCARVGAPRDRVPDVKRADEVRARMAADDICVWQQKKRDEVGRRLGARIAQARLSAPASQPTHTAVSYDEGFTALDAGLSDPGEALAFRGLVRFSDEFWNAGWRAAEEGDDGDSSE